jgi:hypothetical protein
LLFARKALQFKPVVRVDDDVAEVEGAASTEAAPGVEEAANEEER